MTHFVCRTNRATITPESCARYRAAVLARSRRERASLPVVSSACDQCAVGAEHALGRLPERWPDGSPVVRLELQPAGRREPARARHVEVIRDRGSEQLARPVKAPKPPRPKGERKPRKSRATGHPRAGRAPSNFFPFRGEMLSVGQLSKTVEAQRLGLRKGTIRERLRLGWDAERAVTTAAGSLEAHAKRWFLWRGERVPFRALIGATGLTEGELRYHVVECGRSVDEAIARVRASRGAS